MTMKPSQKLLLSSAIYGAGAAFAAWALLPRAHWALLLAVFVAVTAWLYQAMLRQAADARTVDRD